MPVQDQHRGRADKHDHRQRGQLAVIAHQVQGDTQPGEMAQNCDRHGGQRQHRAVSRRPRQQQQDRRNQLDHAAADAPQGSMPSVVVSNRITAAMPRSAQLRMLRLCFIFPLDGY